MKWLTKAAWISGGYVLAGLLAAGAVAVRVATTPADMADASSGMHAFGDVLLFVTVFGAVALLPTGAGLYWLRARRGFWNVLAAAGLGLAVTGGAAAVVFLLTRDRLPPSLALWGAVAVLRLLVTPVCAVTFAVAALLSPDRRCRGVLLAATALEIAVGASAALTWLLSR